MTYDVRKDSHCGLPIVKLRGWFSSKSKRLVDGITEISFMKAVLYTLICAQSFECANKKEQLTRGHLAF